MQLSSDNLSDQAATIESDKSADDERFLFPGLGEQIQVSARTRIPLVIGGASFMVGIFWGFAAAPSYDGPIRISALAHVISIGALGCLLPAKFGRFRVLAAIGIIANLGLLAELAARFFFSTRIF